MGPLQTTNNENGSFTNNEVKTIHVLSFVITKKRCSVTCMLINKKRVCGQLDKKFFEFRK